MEQNNNESQKRLIDLLKILAEIQDANVKLTFATAREIKEKANEVTGNLKKTIVEKAQPYGARAQKLAADYVDGEKKAEQIKDFEARMRELSHEYEEGLKGILKERLDLQNKSYQLSLYLEELQKRRTIIIANAQPRVRSFKQLHTKREELMRKTAMILENSGSNLEQNLEYITVELKRTKVPYEEAKAEVIRVQRAYETVNEKIRQAKVDLQDIGRRIAANKTAENEYREDNESMLEEIDINKTWRDETEALMPKQNTMQRMLGAFLSRINGSHKFKENILGKVSELTEKLPENAKNSMHTVTENISDIASRARDIKYAMIDKAQATLEEKQEKLKAKGLDKKGMVNSGTAGKYSLIDEATSAHYEEEIIPDEEAYL